MGASLALYDHMDMLERVLETTRLDALANAVCWGGGFCFACCCVRSRDDIIY